MDVPIIIWQYKCVNISVKTVYGTFVKGHILWMIVI